MSDHSDEVTASREPESTDDLLKETEKLLSGGSLEEDGARGRQGTEADVRDDREADRGELEEGTSESWFGSTAEPEASVESDEPTRSRAGALRSKLSPTRYFSPKAFLALVLVLGAGLLAGGTFVPLPGGRLVGMFAIAFLVGLLTTKRRYLELAAAGTSVGAVAALFNYAVFTIAGGGGTLIAIGTTAGAVACLIGYYFGRDLRDGVSQDL